MKALCNREGLLTAFNMVSGVVPARSPKPILQNVKFSVDDEDGSVLMGTDLEVGIRHRVLGVKVEEPGSAILPTAKIGPILRTSGDEDLLLETSDEHLLVRGARSSFKLPLEDPSLYPEVPDFAADKYHVIVAGDLKKLIRRTVFATDLESARYALGGVLVELKPDGISMIGTDGRRLAKMVAPATAENDPIAPSGTPVIPVKALKLIERNLVDDDLLVHLTIQSGAAVLVRTEGAVIYSRLVEGRFPRYQDVFPTTVETKVPMAVGPLKLAVEQASIVTSDESRGVDFQFGPGALKLSSQAADVGSAQVDLPLDYQGKAVDITFDPRYLLDALKTLADDDEITAELIDARNAAVFKTPDQYTYVVMPLTRER
ncbi:DNA polymerase III subunit beta [Paludisphaera rhizosphaerae]|uniref:DNA polymerase III subunit beta n=1 Tax=Paludisphaera rhizosphaerae TaxID=2711216 RepID=UPI0013EB0F38|nr:DNA polymerase III subunit beta [Paludisphaera rhizosphaerae]